MSPVSDRKELLPFLSLSLLLMLFLPLLLWLEAASSDSRTRSAAVGYPEMPETLNLGLDQLAAASSIQQKKRDFFALLKPMVVLENAFIQQQRIWLQRIELERLTQKEQALLQALLAEYKLSGGGQDVLPDDPGELRALIDSLLLRVSSVPVELVLVQAANESAWGRSRFAREGNNLFGQWCFSRGCGLVPSQRPEGQYHEVAVFRSPQLSIRAYMKNLNSFWAYEDFRQARASRPELSGAEQALYLADHLTRYSQRGQAYVRELKEMVQVNRALIEQASSDYLR